MLTAAEAKRALPAYVYVHQTAVSTAAWLRAVAKRAKRRLPLVGATARVVRPGSAAPGALDDKESVLCTRVFERIAAYIARVFSRRSKLLRHDAAFRARTRDPL